jgi:hypothetical protein
MTSRPFIHHAAVLILCSAVSFVGHYIQFGIARLTPWIPAAAGSVLWLIGRTGEVSRGKGRALQVITVLFGALTAGMCVGFWPQDIQPLRKKLVFTVMSVSAVVCFVRVNLRDGRS